MALSTVPKDQDRVMRKIISCLMSGRAADAPVGAGGYGKMRNRVWVNAGAPSTSSTGMLTYDLILDIGSDAVYRQTSLNNFTEITA